MKNALGFDVDRVQEEEVYKKRIYEMDRFRW